MARPWCIFNPIDGTFYSYNERTNTLKVFDVKDDAMHFKCKFERPTPGGIVLNPKDPRTIIFLYYDKSCFEIRRLPPNGDLNSSILKRTVMCNEGYGGGFDPSGEVFFFSENTDNNFKVHFYKIQKGEAEEFHEIDLGKETFSFFTPRSHKCGFLDSSHFYVCAWMGVRIYEFAPPCNQWTKNSMPEVSFTKIKTLATDVKCYDAVMFSPEKVMQFSPKALKKFEDVRIHTEN